MDTRSESNPGGAICKEVTAESVRNILFCLVGLVVINYYLVPPSYWVDWDTLMYAINVRVNMAGDLDFSYMHNFIKILLLNSYKACRLISGDFQFLDSVRGITLGFLIASSILIFFTIKTLTDDLVFSFSGALFWLILPGNIFLVHLYEDNVWAISFTCLFLLAAVNIDKSSKKNGKGFLVWTFLAATSLAVGINIHQQLGLLFYLFIILIATHYRLNVSKKFSSIIFFCIWYLVLSIIQNQVAFGEPNLEESIKRLYYNPYASAFPKLWFFTSGLTLKEWTLLIFHGWGKTLFFTENTLPLIYYFFITVLVTSVILKISRKHYYRVDSNFSDFLKRQIWFSSAFLIFIPYSLLYEPQNIERWDSVLPGLSIFLFSTLHYAISREREMYGDASVFARFIQIGLLVFMMASSAQAYSNISKMRDEFKKDSATVFYSEILSFLQHNNYMEKSILLLSEGFRKWDIDSQILLTYPSLQIITLQRSTLRPLHSSYPLQNKENIPDQPITQISFPKESRFIVTPALYREIISASPAYFAGNHVDVLPLR